MRKWATDGQGISTVKTRHLVLVGIGVLCLAVADTACADGITAVLKSPSQVYRLDATTGAYKGSIQVSNGISVGCDGQTIAVLLGSGSVNRYDAKSGSYRGSIQVGKDAQSVQVSGGVIAVRTANQVKRYKADSGSYLGSNQI
jgi:hypothetical protein